MGVGKLGARTLALGDALTFEVPEGPRGTRYVWDFGDGEGAIGPRVTHTWQMPGRFPVAVQRIEDGAVTGASTGVVYVQENLALSGFASVTHGPSEVPLRVVENATAVEVRLEGTGVSAGRVVLADATGAPLVEQAYETADDRVTLVLGTDATDEDGTWVLLVEAHRGSLRWKAEGSIRYDPGP